MKGLETLIESMDTAFPVANQESFSSLSDQELEDFFDLFEFVDDGTLEGYFAGAVLEVIGRWQLGSGCYAGIRAAVAIGDYFMGERPSPALSAKPLTLTKKQEQVLCLFITELSKRPEASREPLVQSIADICCDT